MFTYEVCLYEDGVDEVVKRKKKGIAKKVGQSWYSTVVKTGRPDPNASWRAKRAKAMTPPHLRKKAARSGWKGTSGRERKKAASKFFTGKKKKR